MANKACPKPRPLEVRYSRAAGSMSVGPAGPAGAQGPIGPAGEPGPPIPAPALVATSNIALTGAVVVDSINTNTLAAGSTVLATAQTTTANNGYWVINNSGAWTRPSYYSSDATVAAALGQISGAALGGSVNAGQTFYQFAGTTLAGAKTWVPSKAPACINANEAPWFLKGDGVEVQDAKRDLLLAYAATFPTGCTIEVGPGTYRVNTPGYLPRYVNLRGAGMVVTEWKANTSIDPFDVWVLSGPLNVGRSGAQVIENMRVTLNTINLGTPKWAPSSGAVPLNGYRRAELAHSHVMKLTTKSGNTGIANPIGELNVYSVAKMLGTANVDGQFLLKFITYGQLGTMQFQLSVNAGTTWSATQNTTAGDYNDFLVDAVMGGSTYGSTCKVRIANVPALEAYAATAGAFTMPAVRVEGTTSGEVVITLTSGNTDGLAALAGGQQGWIYHPTAGLLRVKDVLTATTFTAVNVGASSAAAPAAAIGAGGSVITVLPPSPRIEVIGTPPTANYIVDLLPSPGPLGRARSYYYGAATVAEATKHKLGAALSIAEGGYPTGGITTVAGAYHDHAIPATSLTIRVHTGITSTSGSWTYFTPAAGWSMQEGTTVADGANVWTIVRGPACIRTDGVGHLTIRDVWLSGGAFNLLISQSEAVRLEGNCVLEGSGSAAVWIANGDARFGETPEFANNIEIDGNIGATGNGYGIVHDGGFGFTLSGGYSCQQAPSGWIFLAGLRGGDITAQYLESVGQGKTRNAFCFGRGTASTSANGLDFGGGYWGSVTQTSCIDLYNSDGLTFTGIEWGGTDYGLTGCSSCTNLNIVGGQHLQGNPIIDANPTSGFISCQGFELSIGTDVRPTASLTFANGTNAAKVTSRSDYDITGPTAVFSADGFVAGTHGQRLKIRNRTVYAWTIVHNSASEATAANKIITATGADVVTPPGATVEFEYSATDSRWALVAVSRAYNGIRSFAGTTDTVLAADLQGDVESTGGSAVTVTVPTMPAGHVVTYAQQGAGALSFSASGVTIETALAGSGATTVQYQARTLFWRDATHVRIT